MWVTSSLETALRPTAVALGNFDGVHRGHQQVIQPILRTQGDGQLPIAPEPISIASKAERTYATVVTFNPHPREFFTGQRRQLLTPLDEKVAQLEHLGVEQLVLLPFDRELASLSPKAFVEKILVQQLACKFVSVGQDFRFGRQRGGTSADLQAIAASFGIVTNIVALQTCQSERISSSLIRQALQEGDMPSANRLLGRSYTLTGLVVRGQQLGRTIGFPTANLQLNPEKFLPRFGVYCVQVSIAEHTDELKDHSGQIAARSIQNSTLKTQHSWMGVMNIGCRPTVNGTTPTLEVHLLDCSEDLYGQRLTVSLKQFLRPEQKFPSIDALKEQIQADTQAARAFLNAEC